MVFKKVFISYVLLSAPTALGGCACCHGCCDKNKTAPIYAEDKKITPKILQHLNLEEQTLQHILKDVNSVGNKAEKIKKILEYTVDINWDAPMCPNTLIKQEDNLCSYISYFHLMLNNPYYLKFFLILNKTMRTKDTYVLNAICDAVMWCVQRPTFNKNNMCSVANVIKAVFNYQQKNDIINELSSKNTLVKYSDSLSEGVYDAVARCLLSDLKIDSKSDIGKKIIRIISFHPSKTVYIGDKNFFKCFFEGQEATTPTKSSSKETNNANEQFTVYKASAKKVLGIRFHETDYHFFSMIVESPNIWYRKDTLRLNRCGQVEPKDILSFILESKSGNKSIDKNLSFLVYISDLKVEFQI